MEVKKQQEERLTQTLFYYQYCCYCFIITSDQIWTLRKDSWPLEISV